MRAGQVLALLGSSGNSDAPHLHFHIMDASSPLGSEGLPYGIDAFTQLGLSDGPSAPDSGNAWTPRSGAAPVARRRELPVDNAVVTFP